MGESPQDDFSWVMPNALAAMGRPRDPRKTLEFFKDEGIDVIISLTESPLGESLIEEFGFEYHHIPVRDFAAPSMPQIERFVTVVSNARKAGKKVVAHCFAGRGRTGTMIACYLVSEGKSPEEALREVRSLRPGSVETNSQERAVHRYARRLRQRGERREGKDT